MSEQLKPCRVCGRKMDAMEDTWHSRSTDYYLVICPRPCGAEGPKASSYEKAITAWNTRKDG